MAVFARSRSAPQALSRLLRNRGSWVQIPFKTEVAGCRGYLGTARSKGLVSPNLTSALPSMCPRKSPNRKPSQMERACKSLIYNNGGPGTRTPKGLLPAVFKTAALPIRSSPPAFYQHTKYERDPSNQKPLRTSLHGHAFGQIARLVDVAPAPDRHVISQQLERNS